MSLSKFEHLIGTPFKYNETDCFWVLAEYYKIMYDIELTNYARYEGWEYGESNLILENFHSVGFRIVDIEENYKNLKEGDVLLMAIYDSQGGRSSGEANHIGIYTGNGNILHSRFGKTCTHEKFRFRNCHTHTLRHKNVVSIEKPIEKIDYLSILSPAKRELIENARKLMQDAEGDEGTDRSNLS